VIATFFGWTNSLTYFLSISVAVGGAVWAILYRRSGNLVAPWLSHLIVDAAIFLIGFLIVRDQLT
jgi:membrane protease YdiL (CAAX protease family)